MTTCGRAPTQTAVLAGGCFWGMQDLIRKQPGRALDPGRLHRRRRANATYRNHGTAMPRPIEIVFDPAQITYREMLEFFFQIHDPTTLQPPGQRRWHQLPLGDLLPDDEQSESPRTRSPTSTPPACGPARS